MFRKILGVSLVLLATPALAGDLSYDFLGLGYQRVELDAPGSNVDGDGFGINGSFEVADTWFVAAGYSTIDFDFGVDVDQLALGFGHFMPLSPRTDVVATLSYLRADVSASGFGSGNDDGFGVSVGVRSMLSDQLELDGSITYSDFSDGGDTTSFGAGVLYSFTNTIAVGLDISLDDDVTAYGLGARYYFGR